MKTSPRLNRIVLAALLLLAELNVPAAVLDWTNTSGGNWSAAVNWSPNQVPGPTDTANITVAGNYTVTLDVSPAVGGLVWGGPGQSIDVNGQTLTVNGPIQVSAQGQFNVNSGGLAGTNVLTGVLTWSGGSLAGDMTVGASGVLSIVAGGGDGIYGLILTNYGTVNWTNTTLYGRSGSNTQIYNYGTWNAQSDNTFVGGYDGGKTLFENFGTFLKSGNGGATPLDGNVVFNNTGTVLVESGTLDLNNGTGSGADFTTTNTGAISFSSYIFTNINTFAGAGNFVSGGSTTFGGTIVGTLSWDGGNLSGALTVASAGVLNFVAGGGNGFYGLVVTNYGTVNWTNTTLFGRGGSNAQIYNYGTWNAQSDNSFVGGYDGGKTLFENFGTFLKSGNTGVTSLDSGVVFNNIGLVTVESGTLTIGGGTSSGGEFRTIAGANLNFVSTPYSFTNQTRFLGVGSFVESGANFNGSIIGTLGWDGGYLSGFLTVASNGVFELVAGGGNGFDGLVLTNLGTVNWTNTTLYGRGGSNAQIYNYGTWNAQSDNSFVGGYDGGKTLFENFGTFLKSGNGGMTTLDGNVVFNNAGTVNGASGTLVIGAGIDNSGHGIFTTTNGGLVVLNNMTFANGATLSGGSGVELSGVTVINGILTATDLQFSSGTLAGTNILMGTMTWSGGSLSGAMTVASNSVLNIVAGGSDILDGIALTNYGTVNWTNATIYGYDNPEIYNYGTWNAQSDEAFQGGYGGGTTLFDNYGIFAKSGGTNATVLDSDVVFDNTGTLEAQIGTVSLDGEVSLTGGTLNFPIDSQTNYGTVTLGSGAFLSGSVSVDFGNGFLPASGSQFQLLSGPNLNGSFDTGDLPFGMTFLYTGTNVSLAWNGITEADWAAGSSVLQGTITITFLESPGMTVQVVATANGVSHILGATTSGGLGTISFNANQLPNGVYSLQAIIFNADGQIVGDYSRPTFVNNSLVWHGGTLSGNQTWGTNSVNAVDQNVIIPSGVTLTLEPGAIVKFAEGTGIIIEPGGVLDASGATTNEPIILTSIKDDSAGGDSNEDGDNSVPQAGDWTGVLSSGTFLTTPFVEVRYVLQTHSGLMTASQEWSGPQEHYVTGNIIIPANVTLTLSPGAIVKFDLGLNITVEAGGSLIAIGTVAQPIVFTSINDGSVGIDLNETGIPAAAGDWDSIYINGGQAFFDHVAISYGGGPDSLNSGLISVNGEGGVVAVSDSILSQGFYRGIQAEYGSANVTNCVVTGCDRGIQSGLDGPTVVNVVNCTLDNNNYGIFAHGGVMNIANSIIADSVTAGLAFCCGSSLATFDHNDVWSATGTYASTIWPVANQTGIDGNISANPNFVNASQGNYQLNYGSPCINAADGSVAPLTDLDGDQCYNDPDTLIKTGTTNANGVYPDMGAYEYDKNAYSPIDLIVTSVVGPTNVTAGQEATIHWTDANIGTAAAAGPWYDTISLVAKDASNVLWVSDQLVAVNMTLLPGQGFTNAATVTVPGGMEGNYQWQVQVNSEGDVFEGDNWTNSITQAATPVVLTDPTLAISGSAVTNSFTSVGQSMLFILTPQPGQDVLLTLNLLTGGAVDLYIAQGYIPTPQHYDSTQSQWNSSTVSVLADGNSQQPYYVVAYAQSLSSAPAAFTLTATVPGFGLTSVTPGTVGNTGPATLSISGSQLTANMTYEVVDPAGGVHTATAVSVVNNSVAYATFDFSGFPLGNYALSIVGQGTLSNAFAVVNTYTTTTNATDQIDFQVAGPQIARVGRSSSLVISYTNTGGTDATAPIFFVYANNEQFQVEGETAWAPELLEVMAINQTGPAGVLPPGTVGQVVVDFTQITPSQTTSQISVSMADPAEAVSWNSADLQPPFQPADSWGVIYNNFLAHVGTNYGQLQNVLAQDATRLSDLGERVADVNRLITFELQQASDSGAITARYALGAFGRGVPDFTGLMAARDASGNVGILFASTVRLFTLQSGGTYLAQPGDYGTLTVASNGEYLVREKDGTITAFRPDGHLDYTQDLNGNRSTADYSGTTLTGFSDSFGGTISYSYDGQGRITSMTDDVGRVTSFTYDAADEHLLQSSNYLGQINYTWVTNQGPASEHAIASVTYADGTHNYYQYDTLGRVVLQTRDGGAQPITFAYDAFGGVTKTDASGRSTISEPNNYSQTAQVQDPVGVVTKFTFDGNHNRTYTQNTGGQATALSYDALGNIAGRVDALGEQTSAIYQSSDNQTTAIFDPLGRELQMRYDAHGNETAFVYPDATSDQYSYDAAGNNTAWTSRRGLTTRYAFDGNNLLTATTLPDGSVRTLAYDGHRNLLSVTDTNGVIAFTYDAADRLTNVTYPNGQFLQYTYDSANRRTSMVDQDGFLTTYSYDLLGRLAGLADGSGQSIVTYSYDDIGRLAGKVLGNGVTSTFTYAQNGLLQTITNLNSTGTDLSFFNYGYDALGRVTSLNTLAGAFTYAYDANDQLTSATAPGGRQVTYQYDGAGNRILVSDTGTNSGYVANALNQYVTAGSAQFQYDADGNRISKTDSSGTTTYVYDDQDRLVSLVSPTGTWQYEYNALGQRTAVTQNGQRMDYLWDPAALSFIVSEYQSNSLVAHYVYGMDMTSRVDASGRSAYYDFDGSANTADLTDPSGALLDSYSYLPFGEKLAQTGAYPNPFTFVGQSGVADEGEGLYFMRNRWYDPAVGSFTQTDPAGIGAGDGNLYRYAQNRPITDSDPLGLQDLDDETWAVIQAELAANNGDAQAAWNDVLNNKLQTTEAGNPAYINADHYFQTLVPSINNPLGRLGNEPGAFIAGTANVVYTTAKTIPYVRLNWITRDPNGKEPSVPTWSQFMWGNRGATDAVKNTLFGFNNNNLGDWLVANAYAAYYNHYAPQPILTPRTKNLNVPYVASGDPNDKIGLGFGSDGFVTAGGGLFYTIDFANETNATAPAQEVVITDNLSTNLNWSTFQLVQIEFNNVIIDVPSGLASFTTNVSVSTDPNPVKVTVGLNAATGEVTWQIESIDPQTGQLVANPLAGFLPPDNAQGQGEGYVTYSVFPKSGLTNGTKIENQAVIVFDVNAPIATPVVTNTLDLATPTSSINPLAAHSLPVFNVSWSGQDTTGAGIAYFDIYVSIDGGPWSLWLSTTNTSAMYPGAYTNTYAFYSAAYDQVGNTEVPAGTAEAQTITDVPGFPTITRQPISQEVIAGSTATFKVAVQGTEPLKFFWMKGTSPLANKAGKISGAGSQTLEIESAGESDEGSYSVIVSNKLGSVSSSNALLQVVPDLFLTARGTYYGLFAPTNAPREQTNSGSFKISLTVTGALSGDLYLAAQTVPLSGKFDAAGGVQVLSNRRGESPLTTTWQLDTTNQTVTGTVTDGSFVAALEGNQSVFSAAQEASAFEGRYTLIIPGASNSAIGPFGVSYGTVTISPQGVVGLGGSLADGTAFSQKSMISKDGYWPLYVNLYGGKGSLWGWNFFTNHTITNAGPLSWINQTNSSRTALYQFGFTNPAATLSGGLYVPALVLPNDFTATLEGGDLAETIVNGVTISAGDQITLTNVMDETNKLVLTIQRSTGVITGSFANPAKSKQAIGVHGVILKDSTNAQGYFLGTNESGVFTLDPPE
jgi:RHS repeat-associated protein